MNIDCVGVEVFVYIVKVVVVLGGGVW